MTLKDAYETVGENVPALGDVDLAIRTARRRRLRTVVGVPVLAAAAAAAVVLTVSIPRWTAAPDPASSSESTQLYFTEWVPFSGLIGEPAGAGTLVYRDCADCPVQLLRKDGKSFAFADLRSDLVAKLPASGLDGLFLSYDGRWLGLPRGTAYELHDVASAETVLQLPAGPAGSRWAPVGGGLTNGFARYVGDKVTAYADIDWTRLVVEVDEVPDGYARLPVRARGGDLDDAAPVRPGERLATIDSEWARGDDFGLGLRADETFAGPLGVPSVVDPPTTHQRDSGAWQVATAFVERDGELVPSAVLRLGMDDTTVRRIDIPSGWELLGALDRDQVALGQRTAEGLEVVAFGFDGTRRTLHRLGPDTEVLLPGIGR